MAAESDPFQDAIALAQRGEFEEADELFDQSIQHWALRQHPTDANEYDAELQAYAEQFQQIIDAHSIGMIALFLSGDSQLVTEDTLGIIERWMSGPDAAISLEIIAAEHRPQRDVEREVKLYHMRGSLLRHYAASLTVGAVVTAGPDSEVEQSLLEDASGALERSWIELEPAKPNIEPAIVDERIINAMEVLSSQGEAPDLFARLLEQFERPLTN